MLRKQFIKSIVGGAITMTAFEPLRAFSRYLPERDHKMPVLFIGHGSPMNGIEDNEFSNTWKEMGQKIPRPSAVLCISAHWLTRGSYVTAMNHPKTIHDFGGFPEALFQVQYPAPGSTEVAEYTAGIVQGAEVGLDHEWGLDHGTWTVVRHMYPDADIPVLQFSIDYHKPAAYHYQLARELAQLRNKNVLIIGSGNMVHNLGRIAWDKMNEDGFGFDWAIEMNNTFKEHIEKMSHSPLLDYTSLGASAKLAIPTPDHYYPLIYTLGMQSKKDDISFFNDKCVAGSLTMTSVQFG